MFKISDPQEPGAREHLVVDEQFGGGVQALQQHQLVGLRGNSVGERRPDAPLRGPQPHAEGEGPQLRDRALDHGVHVVCPSWEGQPEALWEGESQHTCRHAERRRECGATAIWRQSCSVLTSELGFFKLGLNFIQPFSLFNSNLFVLTISSGLIRPALFLFSSFSVLKPTFFQPHDLMVELIDSAVHFLSVFLGLQLQGFSIFVQQLQLPLQLPLHVLHVPCSIQAGSGHQALWVARRPAHFCLIGRKRADI